MSNVEIGTSTFGGGNQTFTKRKNFYLSDENNGNNIFRVLPPIKSLASKGQYYKYWSVYTNFTDSAGKPRWFASIEEFDFRTKSVRIEDPVATKLRELKAQQDVLKQSGATEEQLNQFYETLIKPFTPRKNYYVNVITQNNEIGTLALPKTAFTSLKALAGEYSNKGIDLTGMRGVFLNFKRVKTGPRNVDVNYSVEVFRESVVMNGESVEKSKTHDLTPDIINRLGAEAEDLGTLFLLPKSDDLAMLAIAPPSQRGLVVDRIVNKSETAPKQEPTMNVSIPGTSAVAVPRVEQSVNGNLNAVLPNMGVLNNVSAAPIAAPTYQAPAAQPVPVGKSPSQLVQMGDDEFHKIFGGAKK